MEPPPGPEYILRGHSTQINCLAFAQRHNWLVSGDESGNIVVWNLDTFRPFIFAKAHDASILTTLIWGNDTRLLTHGRDNTLKVYDLEAAPSLKPTGVPSPANLTPLQPLYTFETNAIGYCKCSLVDLPGQSALVAVPSTLDDNLVDVFHLPSMRRVYRSIGKSAFASKTGMVMALNISQEQGQLRLAAAYEDGRVAAFSRTLDEDPEPVLGENEGWEKIFEAHEHKEPTMGLCIDESSPRIWSIAADHLVARYSLQATTEQRSRAYKTAYPGRGGIAVRNDGKILATAGWDGSVRVHSAQSFKPLAVLSHHRDSLYAVAFQPVVHTQMSSEEQSAALARETPFRTQSWLAAAGKETTISLWKLYPVK